MEFNDNTKETVMWLSEITRNWINEILPISIFVCVSEIKTNPAFLQFFGTILAKKSNGKEFNFYCRL